jgi:hypothetical protein
VHDESMSSLQRASFDASAFVRVSHIDVWRGDADILDQLSKLRRHGKRCR